MQVMKRFLAVGLGCAFSVGVLEGRAEDGGRVVHAIRGCRVNAVVRIGGVAGSRRSLHGCGAERRYTATIRRTSFGIPHITADDYGSLGFGQGFVLAEDPLCTLADQIVKVRSERSRFFGPGENDRNLDSDFTSLALGLRERAERALASESADVRDLVEGYAAGYDAYLEEVGRDRVHGYCKGQPWVRPISALDVQTYVQDFVTFTSARNLGVSGYIAAAQPPTAAATATPTSTVESLRPETPP